MDYYGLNDGLLWTKLWTAWDIRWDRWDYQRTHIIKGIFPKKLTSYNTKKIIK